MVFLSIVIKQMYLLKLPNQHFTFCIRWKEKYFNYYFL